MAIGSFCGVTPFFFRKKVSGIEKKSRRSEPVKTPKMDIQKVSKVHNSFGVAGNFATMIEFKNKISTFRDLLDLSPCVGLASVNELLIWTLNDLCKLYPSIKRDPSVSKDSSMPKVLKSFCDALKSLGDLWTTEEWMVKCRYDSSMKLEHIDLEKIALGMLDDMIKLARERMFDMLDEGEEVRDYRRQTSAFGKALSGSYSDKMSVSCSPETPTSVLPEAWKASIESKKTSYSPPLLLPLRVRAIGKLNPIDVKRLSFQMFSCVVQDRKHSVQISETEKEESPELDAKHHSGVEAADINEVSKDNEMIEKMDEVDGQECETKVDTPNILKNISIGSAGDNARNWIDTPGVQSLSTPDAAAQPETDTTMPLQSLSKLQLNAAEQVRHSIPSSPFTLSSNDEVQSQIASPLASYKEISVKLSPPPPPPPPPPPAATNLLASLAPAPLHPPPPPLLSHLKSSPPSLMTLEKLAPLPTPTPPPPPPHAKSVKIISATPSPPPPMASRNGAPPPPPPPMGTSKGVVPSPPTVMQVANGVAPPPPPMLSSTKSLSPNKATSKLKRSAHMGNLYRLLKGKVEGSSLDSKPKGKKSRLGAASGGKQGMADALAEMTKRSAYFQQIEEDVKTHANSIKEVKVAISSFQTSDMTELLKFHKFVESHLEKLTDETQVLARFEDFPTKKLEALRMAAALYSKLDSIASTLENWPIVSPVSQLLDKVENYFNKIKGDLDALERTKDEDAKKFQGHKIKFDFGILVRIKELTVDLSSSCMELALKEKKDANAKEGGVVIPERRNNKPAKILWRAFQLAFRVYTFAGGHDDRADKLTRELANEIETDPYH